MNRSGGGRTSTIFVRTLFTTVTILSLAGCGGDFKTDYSDLNLTTATGTVTLDGEPLASARVMFEAPDKTFSYGVTDDAGQYTLMFNSEKEGVTPGQKTVRITMGGDFDESGESGDEDPDGNSEGEAAPAAAINIPSRYNSQSELTADVQEGSQTFDWTLESK